MKKHIIELFALAVVFIVFLAMAFISLSFKEFAPAIFFGFMAGLTGRATGNKVRECKDL